MEENGKTLLGHCCPAHNNEYDNDDGIYLAEDSTGATTEVKEAGLPNVQRWCGNVNWKKNEGRRERGGGKRDEGAG